MSITEEFKMMKLKRKGQLEHVILIGTNRQDHHHETRHVDDRLPVQELQPN